MALFDFNAALGRDLTSRAGFDAPADLLAEMRRLGITGALVHHRQAAEGDVRLGNALLVEALKDRPELHACWVMAPPAAGDLPAPEEWVREAVKAGVRAVRLFPRHGIYTLAEWSVGALASAVADARLPLLLDFGEHHWSARVIPWDQVAALCGLLPELHVVVVGATVGDARDALNLLPRRGNLHLELHAFNLPDALGRLSADGLAGRLLFGTGLPMRAGECIVEQTLRAGIADADMHAVCAGNALRLLGLADAKDSAARPPRGLSCPVIDVHAHSGSWEASCTPVNTPEAVVASMQRCGVDKMVLSSFAAIHAEMHAGNRQTADWLRRFPCRLYGYAGINPHYSEETPDELRLCFEEEAGFAGLKLHCGLHGVELGHAGYDYALGFANERRLPVLVHGGAGEGGQRVAERYPGAAFMLAHGCAWDGRDPKGREQYARIRDVENMYVDVAGSAAHRGALAELVELVGVRKVLFGTDFPMFDLAFELGRIAGSGLDTETQAALLGGNAIRLFRALAG